MGAGSTGVACMKLNRKFIGIDINEDYVNTTIKRIKEEV
jgi:site-specific DNA-methyltransferase (adenine-specific)